MAIFTPQSLKFNGSTSIEKPNGGLAMTNGKTFTVIARFKSDADGANQYQIIDGAGRFSLRKESDNEVAVNVLNTTPAGVFYKKLEAPNVFAAANGNYHTLVMSANMADSSSFVGVLDGAEATIPAGIFEDDTLDIDSSRWLIGSTAGGASYANGGISLLLVTTETLTLAQALALFDSDGNLTDPGLEAQNWFSNRPYIFWRGGLNDWTRNYGWGDNFSQYLSGSEDPILPDGESRVSTAQSENYVYKAANDIDVVDNGDGTSTITSAASGFSVYNAVTNQAGLKVGDYITATGSVSSVYPISAIESDGSEITVTGAMTAYAKAATEYASVYRVGRRPT